MADLTSALLCDFAQVREGVLFVSSGGVSRLTTTSSPWLKRYSRAIFSSFQFHFQQRV